jgi:transglutaminase-like putative cysteine protease
MRRYSLWIVGLILSALPAQAEEQAGKLVKDVWDVAYLGKAKIGYLHTTVREVERDGKKLFRASQDLILNIRRFNTVTTMRMESGTEEDADGKVFGVFMTQQLQGKKLVMTGKVEDGQLHLSVDGGRVDKMMPWHDEVIGINRQERLFQDRKAKPGDRITFKSYEPTIATFVTVHADVKDEEEVEVLRPGKTGDSKATRVKERLLRVETKPEKIKTEQDSLDLPGMVLWLNKELVAVRSEVELQPLGKIVFFRATRELALSAPETAVGDKDIGVSSMIRLNRRITNPHDTSRAIYRITIKDDDSVQTALASDARQEVKNVHGNTFELHVHAVRKPLPDAKPATPPDEYLKSCYFLDSDNAEVKAKADEAVGDETDSWKKARLIEKWVRSHMRGDSSIAFCTASEAAQTLRGDCRQHAVLTAAMCRAAEVPARTAVGLIYVTNPQQGPVMVFHMWTEVWINRQWLAIDATLGRGSVGAAHIKIADHSWQGETSLKPFLPVHRVLGKMSIEVVSVE